MMTILYVSLAFNVVSLLILVDNVKVRDSAYYLGKNDGWQEGYDCVDKCENCIITKRTYLK